MSGFQLSFLGQWSRNFFRIFVVSNPSVYSDVIVSAAPTREGLPFGFLREP
jgi:hypothetical protein